MQVGHMRLEMIRGGGRFSLVL